MNRRLLSILRVLWVVLLAWWVCRWLAGIHVGLLLLLLTCTVCNFLAVWIVRFHPRRCAILYGKPILGLYLTWIGWCMGEQLTTRLSPKDKKSETEILLWTPDQFRIAAYRAKQVVRGHHSVIDDLFTRIHESLTLRTRRVDNTKQPPLFTALFAGADGIGKKHLARVLAKLLYRHDGVLTYACDRLTPDMLTGTKETPGELLEAVRRQPFQLILLEHIDAASPAVMHLLHTILTQGSCSARNGGKPISFEHVTLIMTVSKGISALAALAEKNLPSAVWQREATDVLAAETLFDPIFFSAIADIMFCRRPNDHVQSEVAAILLKKETAAHGLTLAYADPEILVALVSQLTDETVFTLLPEQIKRLLQKPLMAAAQQNRKKLSLRVRRPETTFREDDHA